MQISLDFLVLSAKLSLSNWLQETFLSTIFQQLVISTQFCSQLVNTPTLFNNLSSYHYDFVEKPRKFIFVKLSIHKLRSLLSALMMLTDRKLCNNKFLQNYVLHNIYSPCRLYLLIVSVHVQRHIRACKQQVASSICTFQY